MWRGIAPTAVATFSLRPAWRAIATLLIVAAGVLSASPSGAEGFNRQGSSESLNRDAPPPESWAAPPLSEPVLRLTVRPNPESKPEPERAPPQAYCVRLCDGYYFPLTATGDAVSSKKDLCSALCPGTSTEVYVRAGGESTMDNATGPNRKPYKSLANAYAYRAPAAPRCSCQAAAGVPALALTNDPTLRSGDIVVTSKGVRVFAGASRFPFRESDFVDFRAKGRVPRPLWTYLSIIDKPFRLSPVAPVSKAERVSTADDAPRLLVKRR
jgi:hypothetical protein